VIEKAKMTAFIEKVEVSVTQQGHSLLELEESQIRNPKYQIGQAIRPL
jgi:hypothetical protein